MNVIVWNKVKVKREEYQNINKVTMHPETIFLKTDDGVVPLDRKQYLLLNAEDYRI